MTVNLSKLNSKDKGMHVQLTYVFGALCLALFRSKRVLVRKMMMVLSSRTYLPKYHLHLNSVKLLLRLRPFFLHLSMPPHPLSGRQL
jgi:hypothetical protein